MDRVDVTNLEVRLPPIAALRVDHHEIQFGGIANAGTEVVTEGLHLEARRLPERRMLRQRRRGEYWTRSGHGAHLAASHSMHLRPVRASSRGIDRYEPTFDHDRLVANFGAEPAVSLVTGPAALNS